MQVIIQLQVQEVRIIFESMTKYKIFISILAGALCFVLSPYGIQMEFGITHVSIPWSILFPIIISLAFGWKFALITAASGGALYPFYLWEYDGFSNITTSLLYTLTYLLISFINDKKVFSFLHAYYSRLILILILISFSIYGYYAFVFETILSLNPPFWTDTAYSKIEAAVLNGIIIKDSINYIVIILVSSTLLKLPVLQWIMMIKTEENAKNNNQIFLFSLLFGFGIWAIFYLLVKALIPCDESLHKQFLSLSYYVIVLGNLILFRIIMVLNEKNNSQFNTILENEHFLKALFNTIPDYIWLKDTHGVFLKCNKKVEQIFGLSEKNIIGKTDYDFVSKELADTFRKNDLKALQSDVPLKIEENIIKGREQSSEILEAIKAPFKINNKVIGVLGIGRDITERKKYEETLHKAKSEAEEANRLKSEFINNLSHEIRTPMNGIVGFTHFLAKENISSQKRNEYAGIVLNSSHQLLHIIDDLLEISRLGTQQVKIHETEVDLYVLLTEMVSVFQIDVQKKNLTLLFDAKISKSTSHIIIDETKLNKILSNLIENAIKYTHQGHIKISCEILNSTLVISVEDTGIGINPEAQEIIFNRFIQENKSSGYFGGLGLGLAIARENAILMNGNIKVESEKGKGSTFILEIPYQPLLIEENITEENKTSQKTIADVFTILIAEDEKVNYLYLKEILTLTYPKAIIMHAENGKEAITLLENNTHTDLVFMDLKMPVMDGFEATALIKKHCPNIPVIAQTAYSGQEEKELALESGCDDFVTKPLNDEKVIQLVSKYLKFR